MNHQDPILATVRKLLALAEDPAATEHEAETYTAKATQLMADYGIDRALLAHADPSSDPVGDRVVALDAPYAADKADLLATIATRLRCAVVQRRRRQGGTRELSLHLFGHASDLERVEILFTSLLLQSASALARTPVPPRRAQGSLPALLARRLPDGDRATPRRGRAAGRGRGRRPLRPGRHLQHARARGPLCGGAVGDGAGLPPPRHRAATLAVGLGRRGGLGGRASAPTWAPPGCGGPTTRPATLAGDGPSTKR